MSEPTFDLTNQGIHVGVIHRNISPARLYEKALTYEKGSAVTNCGALAVYSGAKTGRSPSDKRMVLNPASMKKINWGKINIKLDEHTYMINHERAVDYLNTLDRLYVVDGYAGWDKRYQIRVRVICSRAYHALFMHNMMIRPTEDELADFTPDYTIINAGHFPANRYTSEMTSTTSVDISFERQEMVILGTEYAGEMKKGIFTLMNYIMPDRGILSMHCAANEGPNGDVTLFFGLSGTGKTTLSADPRRQLIGDDEHCWTTEGIFNIEGGCYAKCIHLSGEKEKEIYQAIRFGTVLENVVYHPKTRIVNYHDGSITENTRAAYPLDYIPNAKIPGLGGHPRNIVFLTCDAFGVLPPVSKLNSAQAMYHYISGYTAKVAGTEMGVTEPKVTFSACFGEAFLVWHPFKYATLLAKNMEAHEVDAWLINTGWSGGPFGIGSRLSLKHTRAIIDAIHDGTLTRIETTMDPHFGFHIPVSCPGVPDALLSPRGCWKDSASYDEMAKQLVKLFKDNFTRYESEVSPDVRAAGPQ